MKKVDKQQGKEWQETFRQVVSNMDFATFMKLAADTFAAQKQEKLLRAAILNLFFGNEKIKETILEVLKKVPPEKPVNEHELAELFFKELAKGE